MTTTGTDDGGKHSKASKGKKAAGARSMPEKGKDPRGGLTAAGRKFYAETEGSHLRPGVKGPADTPEKMKRKGSFLTRHYTHPRGPVVRDGESTRQALQAAAWGEPVPKTKADESKLAAKGRALLQKFHESRAQEATSGAKAQAGAASKKAAKKGAKKTGDG